MINFEPFIYNPITSELVTKLPKPCPDKSQIEKMNKTITCFITTNFPIPQNDLKTQMMTFNQADQHYDCIIYASIGQHLDPTNFMNYLIYKVHSLYCLGQFASIFLQKDIKDSIKKPHFHVILRYYKACALYKLGQYDQSLQTIEDGLDQQQTDLKLYISLLYCETLVYFQRTEFLAAFATAKKALNTLENLDEKDEKKQQTIRSLKNRFKNFIEALKSHPHTYRNCPIKQPYTLEEYVTIAKSLENLQ